MTGGARIIKLACEDFLCRKLTQDEDVMVEEIALNWFTMPVVNRIHMMHKRKAKRQFGLIYLPIMRGIMRGAARRSVPIRIQGRLRELYTHFADWVGRDLQPIEMEIILIMASSDVDIHDAKAACAAAERRGIRRVPYVKAIIDGNRNIASMRINPKNFKDAGQMMVVASMNEMQMPMPRVDEIRERWQNTLRNEVAQKEAKQVEDAAKRALDDRGFE